METGRGPPCNHSCNSNHQRAPARKILWLFVSLGNASKNQHWIHPRHPNTSQLNRIFQVPILCSGHRNIGKIRFLAYIWILRDKTHEKPWLIWWLQPISTRCTSQIENHFPNPKHSMQGKSTYISPVKLGKTTKKWKWNIPKLPKKVGKYT